MVRTSPITGRPIEEFASTKLPLWRRLNWKRILFLVAALVVLSRFVFPRIGLTERDRVLKTVDEIQAAVESKSLLRFERRLSRDYRDGSGNDRTRILGLAQYHFKSRDSIQIVRLADSVEFADETEETATVTTRVQIFSSTDFGLSRDGETYLIRLRKEGGDWRILSVDPKSGRWPGR